MKKKIGLVFSFLFLSVFVLTGCSFSSSTKYTYQENIVTIEVSSTVSSVVDKVNNACIGVYATSTGSNMASSGSGVVYKKTGSKYYAVTNYHVIEDTDTVKAYINNSVYITCTVEAVYPGHDLACLSFEAAEKYNVGVVDIDETLPVINPGQTVIAIGCPLGLNNFNYVSVGVASTEIFTSTVSAGGKSYNINIFYHDAAINSGNSGGALFDINGSLIGINFRKIVSDNNNDMVEGMGQSIYIEEVLNFLESNNLL